ncbi:MAG: nucleotide-binding protein [Lachnospiraceae bacterium]|nr:nucleotide-binding protein [Lachnospiraceae bacterium]
MNKSYKRIIKGVLKNNGYSIALEGIYRKTGYKYKLTHGGTVFINEEGKYWCRGKEKESIMEFLKSVAPGRLFANKLFVVYGHDETAKNELEAILERFDVIPVFLSDEPAQGETIIEQLERCIQEVNYGIVLATPDDVGYLLNEEKQARARMRQNVVFELGMLYEALGRKRVAILIKQAHTIELPSDIDGIKRFQFQDHVKEVEGQLRTELVAAGYSLRRR